MKDDTIIALAVAGGIVILGYKLSESVGSAVENVGGGLRESLSGAGSALEYSGMGVYELGSGVGYGVGQLGAGTGAGLASVGAGVYEIGRGTGYAISGANPQDIIQTITNALRSSTAGQEASTYNQGSLKAPIQETNTQNLNQTASAPSSGIMPTAQSTLGLQPFTGINLIGSWLVSKAKSLVSGGSSASITGAATSSGSVGVSTSSGSVRTSTTSSSGSSSGSSSFLSLNQQSIKTYEALGIPLMSTKAGVVPANSVRSTKTTTTASTKKWYNPLSWF